MHLSFADGTSAEAGVVLGADGVRSVVRTYVVGEESGETEEKLGVVRAAFTNTFAYRAFVEVEKL